MSSINLELLRNHEFRTLIAGLSVSVFGDGLTSVALSFAVLDITGSVSDVGLVLASRLIPVIFLMLLGGVAADRRRRDRIMAISQLASGIFQGSLAALLLTGAARLWMMMCLYFLLGCAQATFKPASSGLIPQIVAKAHLTSANGMVSVASSAAQIIGPAVGGALIAVSSPGVAIGIDAATFLISAIFLFGLRVRHAWDRPDQFKVMQDLAEGWKIVRSKVWLWGMISYFSLFQFAVLGGLYVLGPAVARSHLGGADAWGVLLTASGVGSLIGASAALRWQPRRSLVGSNIGILGVAPIFVALALGLKLSWDIGGILLYGAALTYSGALWDATLQSNVGAAELGRVSAYDWIGSTAFRPLGLVVAGPVAVVLGVTSELWVIAGIVVSGALVLLSLPSVRTVRIFSSQAAVPVNVEGIKA
jgi:MFS family permease